MFAKLNIFHEQKNFREICQNLMLSKYFYKMGALNFMLLKSFAFFCKKFLREKSSVVNFRKKYSNINWREIFSTLTT